MGAAQSRVSSAITNVALLANAPAISLAQVYHSNAAALAISAQNATLTQQHGTAIQQASTLAGVAMLLGLDVSSTAASMQTILEIN